MNRTRFVLVGVVASIALSTLPAWAADDLAGTESHCVVDVIDEAPDGELIVGEPRCYDEFSLAALDASGGQVRLPMEATGAVVFTDGGAQQEMAAFALGIHYDGTGGTGSSITVSGSSCTGGHWNTPPTWANRISSSYNGCGRLRHYDGPGKTGDAVNTVGAGTTDNLGAMNNRTESVAYHAS